MLLKSRQQVAGNEFLSHRAWCVLIYKWTGKYPYGHFSKVWWGSLTGCLSKIMQYVYFIWSIYAQFYNSRQQVAYDCQCTRECFGSPNIIFKYKRKRKSENSCGNSCEEHLAAAKRKAFKNSSCQRTQHVKCSTAKISFRTARIF